MTSTKAKSEANKARVLYWFRTDLRVHDSPALQAALALDQEMGIEAFYPVGSCWGIQVSLLSADDTLRLFYRSGVSTPSM
jgi:deoxyribodipyrimidine photolyase